MIIDLDYDAYDRIWAVRWSLLKSMRVSPLQFLHDLHSMRSEARQLRVGIAVHALLLEPDRADAIVTFGGAARRGKAWDAFRAAHAGATILLHSEWDAAEAIAEAVMRHNLARGLITAMSALREHVFTWVDEDTGMACKARIDICGPRVVELKSTGQLLPELFGRVALDLGYHGQLAFYTAAARANGLVVDRPPLIIAAQSEPPHDVAVYELAERAVELGHLEVMRCLGQLATCRRERRWPGICPGDPLALDLPRWAYPEERRQTFTIGGEKVAL